jgi:four helix bundle protein
MHDHTRLIVWQRAQAFAAEVHAAAQRGRMRRTVGLAPQLRRASASIGATIAEGAAQETQAQFARFLQVAIASARETANHLELARDTGALDLAASARLLTEVGVVRRMLTALLARVREQEAAAGG